MYLMKNKLLEMKNKLLEIKHYLDQGIMVMCKLNTGMYICFSHEDECMDLRCSYPYDTKEQALDNIGQDEINPYNKRDRGHEIESIEPMPNIPIFYKEWDKVVVHECLKEFRWFWKEDEERLDKIVGRIYEIQDVHMSMYLLKDWCNQWRVPHRAVYKPYISENQVSSKMEHTDEELIEKL